MKLRGLWNLILLVAAVSILAGVYLYRNSQNSALVDSSKDDMKSQLTSENSPEKPLNLKQLIAKNLQKQEDFVERKDFDTSAVDQERFYTENEILQMNETQFIALLKETELRLPKMSDIKKIPEGALHHVPAPVLQAGKDLGLLKEILKVHESFEGEAAKFYQVCAKNSEHPTPVRALCLTNLVTIKKKNGEKINLSQYPKQLIELTRMITEI